MNDLLDKEAELKKAEEEVKEEVNQFLEKEGGSEQGMYILYILYDIYIFNASPSPKY